MPKGIRELKDVLSADAGKLWNDVKRFGTDIVSVPGDVVHALQSPNTRQVPNAPIRSRNNKRKQQGNLQPMRLVQQFNQTEGRQAYKRQIMEDIDFERQLSKLDRDVTDEEKRDVEALAENVVKSRKPYDPPAIPLTRQGIHPHPGPKSKKGQLRVVKKSIKRMKPMRKSYASTAQPQARQNFNTVQSVAAAYGSTFQQNRTQTKKYSFQHCEFIGDVAGRTAFTNVYQLAINPGIPAFLPYLANIANMFESYEFNKLTFEFRNSSGTGTAGLVMMAIDYDALDEVSSVLNTEQEFMDYSGAVSSSIWMPLKFNFDKRYDRKVGWGGPRTVRSTSAPVNSDLRLFDVGQFYLAVSGAATADNNVTAGKLYVSYDVSFLKPRLAPLVSLSGSTNSDTVTAAAPFGPNGPFTPSTSYRSSNNFPYILNNGGGSVTFYGVRPGTYYFSYQLAGSVLVAPSLIFNTAANLALGTTIVDQHFAFVDPTGVNCTSFGAIIIVTKPMNASIGGPVLGTSGAFVVKVYNSAATVTFGEFILTQVNQNTTMRNGITLTKKQFDDAIVKLSTRLSAMEIQIDEEKEEREAIIPQYVAPVKPINNWDTVSNKSLTSRVK